MGPVLKYPGAKWNLAEWIISHMPPHKTYLEPYFGSGAVFFNKKPSVIETINDVDGHIVSFFKVLRDYPDELARVVKLTPWSRLEYEAYLTSAKDSDYFKVTNDPIENARRLLIRMNMGHGSRTSDRGGWRHNVQASSGNTGSMVWKSVPQRIYIAADRLKDAQIECQPGIQLIKRYRYPEVLIYADPPYILQTRKGRMYKHEMADTDHIELLNVLDEHPGPVLLSGYNHEIYNERLRHWARETKRSLAQGGRIRKEVLWLNPVAVKATSGRLLFDIT